MKTILFVIVTLELGGAERHLVQVLPKLAGLDYCPVVYTLTHRGKLAQEIVDRGVKVVQPPFADYLKMLSASVEDAAFITADCYCRSVGTLGDFHADW